MCDESKEQQEKERGEERERERVRGEERGRETWGGEDADRFTKIEKRGKISFTGERQR